MNAKKAIIVQGGWVGHTPKESAELFAKELTDAGYDVFVSDTLDTYADASRMGEADLIVPIWTMGKIEKEQEAGLLAAVNAGAGIAGFHGGMIDSFRNNTSYQWMTGGQWVSHPGGVIPNYTVRVIDSDHEITRGLDDFVLPDTEQYYCHTDPGNHVLAETTFTGEHGTPDEKNKFKHGTVMPYAWTRRWGKGRVFCAAWGHTCKDFDIPEAREIVKRGMIWATR